MVVAGVEYLVKSQRESRRVEAGKEEAGTIFTVGGTDGGLIGAKNSFS